MCYLVAKDRNAHGCFALKTTHGKHLVELKRELNREVGYKGVQLVTISRPTAYGEYAPYHFVDKSYSHLCYKHFFGSSQSSNHYQQSACYRWKTT